MKLRFVASGLTLGALLAVGCSLSAAAAAPIVGKPAPGQPVSLFVKLPLRNEAELETLSRVVSDPGSPEFRHFLSVAQFRSRYAAAPGTVAQAVSTLRASGFHVRDTRSQLIVANAPAAVVERTFGVHLALARAPGGTQLTADAAPSVPRGLAAIGASVIGLNIVPRPLPQPQSVRYARPIPQNRYGPAGGYWFTDLKQAYSYPAYKVANGTGVTVAVVGLSDSSDSDAFLYFNHERLGGFDSIGPAPALEHLNLGGAAFDPSSGISAEANIDVQQSGGSAPGATILAVDVPAIAEGFLYGYSYIDDYNAADIVSTSYGECELEYTAAYNGGVDYTGVLQSYHQLFVQGNVEGITFTFSSGDYSGKPCAAPAYFGPGKNGVYPAIAGTSIWSDDPNATSVGGTNLVTSVVKNSLQSTYVSENALPDPITKPFDLYGTGNSISGLEWGSGGGTSVVFKKPSYQYLLDTGRSSMRTDPDVSMQMGGCPGIPNIQCNPDDSYGIVYIGGTAYGYIGTSLSSPEFAGLLAVFEQAQGGRFGNVNQYIYSVARTNSIAARTVFHQGIPGSDGVVVVKPGQLGYNPINGVGTPITNIFTLLPDVQLAGNPRTLSNP